MVEERVASRGWSERGDQRQRQHEPSEPKSHAAGCAEPVRRAAQWRAPPIGERRQPDADGERRHRYRGPIEPGDPEDEPDRGPRGRAVEPAAGQLERTRRVAQGTAPTGNQPRDQVAEPIPGEGDEPGHGEPECGRREAGATDQWRAEEPVDEREGERGKTSDVVTAMHQKDGDEREQPGARDDHETGTPDVRRHHREQGTEPAVRASRNAGAAPRRERDRTVASTVRPAHSETAHGRHPQGPTHAAASDPPRGFRLALWPLV